MIVLGRFIKFINNLSHNFCKELFLEEIAFSMTLRDAYSIRL